MRQILIGKALLLLLFLFSAIPASAEIYVIYHVATLNNWKDIVEEQMALLESSALLENADALIVNYVGEETHEIDRIFADRPYAYKTEVIHASNDIRLCEFPSICKVKEVANDHPDSLILYIHSKGVTHWKKSPEEAVTCWRRYMQYFLVENWRTCVEQLQEYDICGVEWRGRPPHFSGNFWWATAKYLNTCPMLGEPSYEKRWDCEFFIGKGIAPKVKVLHNARRNMYSIRYTEEHYK